MAKKTDCDSVEVGTAHILSAQLHQMRRARAFLKTLTDF